MKRIVGLTLAAVAAAASIVVAPVPASAEPGHCIFVWTACKPS